MRTKFTRSLMLLLSTFAFCLSTATNLYAQGGTTGGVGPVTRPFNGGPISSALKRPNGTCALPSDTYTTDPDLGSYRIGANNEGFCAGSVAAFDYNATRVSFSLPISLAGDGTIDSNGTGKLRFKSSAGNGVVADVNTNGTVQFFRTDGTTDTAVVKANTLNATGEVLSGNNASGTPYLSGTVYTGWKNSTLLRGDTNGELQLTNNAVTAGVRLSFATDSLLSVLTRAGANSATIKAAALQSSGVAFASLPTAEVGKFIYINDSTTDVWGATVTGGGALKVLAWFNGTNWTVYAK